MNEREREHEEEQVTAVALAPLAPGLDVGRFREAVRAYRDLQRVLDDAMPDCKVTVQGREFRKKAYWRGVSTAFKIDCVLVEERYEPGADGDWGWYALYRATMADGTRRDGDGAAFRSERIVYQTTYDRGRRTLVRDAAGNRIEDVEKTAEAASRHNIRSLAHTRAMNRAISNAVGFGEVSLEELPRSALDDTDHGDARPPQPASKPQAGAPAAEPWSDVIDALQGEEAQSSGAPRSMLGLYRDQWDALGEDQRKGGGHVTQAQATYILQLRERSGLTQEQLLASVQKRWPAVQHAWQLSKAAASEVIKELKGMAEQAQRVSEGEDDLRFFQGR